MKNTETIQIEEANPNYLKVKPIAIGDTFSSKYGEIQVIEYKSAKNISIKFLNTGFIKVCQASALRNGKVKDNTAPSTYGIGYIGVGDQIYMSNLVEKPAATKWKNMLKRCYDRNEVRSSYALVNVCLEWWSFQSFSEWFCNHPNSELGFDLDKDLLPFLRGDNSEKIYSPMNCTLIPRTINSKLAYLQRRLSQVAKAKSVHPAHATLPTGINFDRSHGNFRIFVNGVQVATRKRLGAALEVYEKLNISNFIKELDVYSSDLDEQVKNALASFKARSNLDL